MTAAAAERAAAAPQPGRSLALHRVRFANIALYQRTPERLVMKSRNGAEYENWLDPRTKTRRMLRAPSDPTASAVKIFCERTKSVFASLGMFARPGGLALQDSLFARHMVIREARHALPGALRTPDVSWTVIRLSALMAKECHTYLRTHTARMKTVCGSLLHAAQSDTPPRFVNHLGETVEDQYRTLNLMCNLHAEYTSLFADLSEGLAEAGHPLPASMTADAFPPMVPREVIMATFQ
jgi:hypothetical protein